MERQARVREALEAAVGGAASDEDDSGAGASSSSSGSSGSSSGPKWWQERFQALFLPNIRYPDGGVGFVQVSWRRAA